MLRTGTPHPPLPETPAFSRVGYGLFSWFGWFVNGTVGCVVGGVPGGEPAGGGTVIVTGTFGFTTPTCAHAGLTAMRINPTVINVRFIFNLPAVFAIVIRARSNAIHTRPAPRPQ